MQIIKITVDEASEFIHQSFTNGEYIEQRRLNGLCPYDFCCLYILKDKIIVLYNNDCFLWLPQQTPDIFPDTFTEEDKQVFIKEKQTLCK